MTIAHYREASIAPKSLIPDGYLRWRILTTASNDASLFYITIAEINMRTVLGTDGVMTGGTLSADAIYGASYDASKAIDGNSATAWITPQGTVASQHWWEIQFPTIRDIKQLRLQAYSTAAGAAQMVKNFQVQFHNGSSWVTKATIANQTAWGTSENRIFTL